MNFRWIILDWMRSKDESLIIVEKNHDLRLDWGEVSCLPEFWFGELRCRVLNIHGFPFFGSCVYCGKTLVSGDFIGWNERYDPNEDVGSILMDILPEIINFGMRAKIQKNHSDYDAIYKEAHR